MPHTQALEQYRYAGEILPPLAEKSGFGLLTKSWADTTEGACAKPYFAGATPPWVRFPTYEPQVSELKLVAHGAAQ